MYKLKKELLQLHLIFITIKIKFENYEQVYLYQS
jgi:hypothetical protein